MPSFTKPLSMRELLSTAKHRLGLTDEQIGEAAGIQAAKKGKVVNDVLKRAENISLKLADWTLQNTFGAEDPMLQALTSLELTGMNGDQLAMIRNLALQFIETNGRLGITPAQAVAANILRPVAKPPARKGKGTYIIADHDQNLSAIDHVSEEPPLYALHKNIESVDRREEIRVLPMFPNPVAGAKPLKHFENLAAGFGEDLSESDDVWYFSELDNWKGLNTVEVISDSMERTILKGDILAVKPYGQEGLELPPRGDNPKASYFSMKAQVVHDDIYIVRINEGKPTLKRVIYDLTRGVANWRFTIVADNPHCGWHPVSISSSDTIVFLAKVIGRGQASKK